MWRKAKIIATVGPASNSAEMIGRLIEAGVNVFRLNFSHGEHADHSEVIATIRREADARSTHVGILADLQGPKIRTGKTGENKTITLSQGSKIRLVTDMRVVCTSDVISISYDQLIEEVETGQNILINDGAVRLSVQKVDKKNGYVECVVENTGSFSSHKGVNFPGTRLSVPALTEKDKNDLAFIITQDIDYIALSFVRRRQDLQHLRKQLGDRGDKFRLIAKIEKPEALDNIDEILDACDGIMVARGDLGVETSPYRIPILQKKFIGQAGGRGKVVIVATQMLESMIHSPRPTRAELTDVANAILDGSDALMLSGETAVGKYPLEAVQTMAKITEETEQSGFYRTEAIDLSLRERYPPHAVCEAAERAGRELGGAPVILFSESGDTSYYMAKVRNQSRIFAFTPSRKVANQLSLAWNTMPVYLPFNDDVVALVNSAEEVLVKQGNLWPGDLVVVISGTNPARGATNFLRIKRIGEK
ncbi:MAG: pyruvate kinase [Chitinivibrionales bacterium]